MGPAVVATSEWLGGGVKWRWAALRRWGVVGTEWGAWQAAWGNVRAAYSTVQRRTAA